MAGDRVKAGQPLFSIDDRDYRAAVDQDEAAVSAASASVAAINQSLILQRDAVDQARATLDGAEAEWVRAALDQTRYAELARDAWATRQRLETASADAQKADAGVTAAKAALARVPSSCRLLDREGRNRSLDGRRPA
jgi:multidrug resistance efflux pump